MRLLDNEYYYEQAKANTVVWKSEYTAIEVDPDYPEAITRVKRVFVKYRADDQYYTPLREENPALLDYGKDYYADWSETDPFYYIQDNSVFIFPTPQEAVTDGYFIEVITQPPSLLTSDTADKVQVPERINEMIEDGMMPFGAEYIGKPLNEVQAHEQIFNTRLRETISDLSGRGDGFSIQDTAIQSQFQ